MKTKEDYDRMHRNVLRIIIISAGTIAVHILLHQHWDLLGRLLA